MGWDGCIYDTTDDASGGCGGSGGIMNGLIHTHTHIHIYHSGVLGRARERRGTDIATAQALPRGIKREGISRACGLTLGLA